MIIIFLLLLLDGYRLSLRKLPTKSELDMKIIIPGRTLNEINKIIEDDEENVTVFATPNHVIFNIGDTMVYSKVVGRTVFQLQGNH